MTWPWTRSQKRHEEMLATFQVITAEQNKVHMAMINAMSEMANASAKNAEVLNSYLKLFQTEGEPQRWVDEPEERNAEELAKLGFPKEGTEAQQAEWVLQHLEDL